MYKTLLFDLDDTLLDFQASQRESLRRIHAEFYTALNFSVFEQAFKTINAPLWLRVGSAENPLTPDEIKQIRFKELHKHFGDDRDIRPITLAFEHMLSETADWFPNVKSTIEFLSQQNYVMGIITNGAYATQRRKYEKCELEKWFHGLIISDEVGFAKPNKQIFDIAISTLHREAISTDSVLMVGDSLHHDGHGAKNAGFDFCFVSTQTHEESFVTHQIHSVAKLPEILGHGTD